MTMKYLAIEMRLESGHLADVYFEIREGTIEELADLTIKGVITLKAFAKDGLSRPGIPLPPGLPSIRVWVTSHDELKAT